VEVREAEQPLAPGLYLVATPIGNLEDMTLRGLRVLRSVDRIACEDTRQSQKLLGHYGIATPVVSCHAHNEGARVPELLGVLAAGGRVAVISDAGTPGISDPGMHLAAAAIAAGVRVYPVPGANAAVSALVGSGLGTEGFAFYGFLPEKAGARRTELERLAGVGERVTLVFYEAPHRILDTLGDVAAVWPRARVVVARELTKVHEEFLRGTAAEVRAVLGGRDRVRGEMVLLVEAGVGAVVVGGGSMGARVAEVMAAEGVEEKDALKRVARERGLGKSEAYRELQRERGRR
jgi:16S rRNA (cytidine1402-2'-O)-methyltransferase